MSVRARGWHLYDALVERNPERQSNPWTLADDRRVVYRPDYHLLERLLGVPLLLDARSQTGVPALALDVWVANEFRRAGFDPDAVWPRATAPRVLPAELATLMTTLNKSLRQQLADKINAGSGLGGVTSASANLLGKNYVKQVDVVMSSWQTGPELMVSTKRMDSSFGRNAANRVEESYGDAKNLRLRHPHAALGFVYGLRSTALTLEPDKAEWLIDLLGKLGDEADAYHAVALIIPSWVDTPGSEQTRPATTTPASGDPMPHDELEDEADDPLVAAGLEQPSFDVADPVLLSLDPDADAQLARLPVVRLAREHVPEHLSPDRFFDVMIRRVLANCPVNFHRGARERLANPLTGRDVEPDGVI